MDPVTICFVLAAPVFFVICYMIFNMATRESSFEETYGKEALKLLTEDKNSKNKVKNGKVKKIGKTTEKRAETLLGTTETTKVQTTNFEIVDDLPETNVPEESKPSVEENKAESIDGSQSSKTTEPAKAKKNKKKTKKVDSVESSEVPKKEREESADKDKKEVVQPTSSNVSKTRGKREVTDGGVLNFDKLIERLSSSSEIEPEYSSFVSQFAEQNKQKESKLNELVLKLQREISSKNHELEHLHDQLYDSQTNAAKIQSLESALKDAKEKHSVYVSSVTPKLSENYQLRETIRKLEELNATQNKVHANSMDKLKRDSEQICNSMRNSLAQTNDSLHQKDLLIKHMEKEFQQQLNSIKEKESEFDKRDAVIEDLRSAVKQKDRLISEIEAEIKRKDILARELSEEFKQKESYLIRDRDEQIKLANSKLEAELKESLQRIDELRSRNYKLVESINALYTHKNPGNSDENKKPIADSQELKA